jgi:transposase
MTDARQKLEARRLAARDLFRQGFSQARVSRALGVSRTTASRWKAKADNPDGLLARDATGRPPIVPMARLAEIVGKRKKWTGKTLVAAVLRATGTRYDPDHLLRRAKGARP